MQMRVGRTLILTAVLALAACGGTTAGSGGGVDVSAKDYQFTPGTLTAGANSTVTINFKNDGTVEHNFSITELGVSQDVAAGQSASITVNTKDNATLQFFCKYHGSTNNMVGTMTVGSGGTGTGASTSPAPATNPSPYHY